MNTQEPSPKQPRGQEQPRGQKQPRGHRPLQPRGGWLLALCLLAFGASGCGRSAEFPSQPISLICPWSAGGGTDRVSRQIAAQLESELGVPVNVINATGGGGVTGHTRGAVARPDGYTLTMITVELSMLHWRGLTNVTHEDFAPLQLLNRDAAALLVRGDSPHRSLDDLVDSLHGAAESGEKLKASGTAYGGIWHIAVAGWLDARGLGADAANWISINGAGPSIQELLAGGVDFICCSLAEADAVLAGGQVRALGVMSPQRIRGFADVPTFTEQGHAWSLAGWRGLAAPRDTPPERLQVLADATARVTASESFRQFMANSGFDLSLEPPTKFAQTLADQDALFGEILNSEGLRNVSGDHFGPLLFPTALAMMLPVVLGFVVRDILRQSQQGDAGESPGRHPQAASPSAATVSATDSGEAVKRRPLPWREPAAVFVAVIFYCWVSESLGFIATAVLMLGGLLTAFRARPAAALAVGVVVGLVTYQIFGVLLRVPLPRGMLEW